MQLTLTTQLLILFAAQLLKLSAISRSLSTMSDVTYQRVPFNSHENNNAHFGVIGIE